MTYDQFNRLLDKVGFPHRYDHFGPAEKPEPEYIVWYTNGTDNFKADNMVYKKIQRIEVELYTRTKSPSAEAKLEKALNEAHIPWDQLTSGKYIREEDAYFTAYEFNLNLE